MDDVRLGAICRALRRRLGLRQSDLAERAGVHQTTISRLERGEFASLSVGIVRGVFAAIGARFDGQVSWRGGDVDRLVDDVHSDLVETSAEVYRRHGWQIYPEVTFQRYGDRGSIDLLAAFPARRAVVINEIKSDLYSEEETHRRLDVKVRLASAIVEERLGWRPVAVARVLVVPESMTIRRKIERHAAVFAAVYPGRARELFRWLEDPTGSLGAVWFLSRRRPGVTRRVRPGRTRVSRRGPRSKSGAVGPSRPARPARPLDHAPDA